MPSARMLLGLSLLALAVTTASALWTAADAQGAKLRFGVGPLQPTPDGDQEGVRAVLRVSRQEARPRVRPRRHDRLGRHLRCPRQRAGRSRLDGARGATSWPTMTPGVPAIATAKYDGKPIYHAIVVVPARPRSRAWPDDAQRQARLLCRCRLDLGLAHPDLLVQDARDRPQELLQLFGRAPRTPPTRSRVASGQVDLRDGLRPQPQRDDRGRKARQERDRGGLDTPTPCPTTPSPCARASIPPLAEPAPADPRSGSPRSRPRPSCPTHYTGFVAATHAEL